jgi:hypothetical protein
LPLFFNPWANQAHTGEPSLHFHEFADVHSRGIEALHQHCAQGFRARGVHHDMIAQA